MLDRKMSTRVNALLLMFLASYNSPLNAQVTQDSKIHKCQLTTIASLRTSTQNPILDFISNIESHRKPTIIEEPVEVTVNSYKECLEMGFKKYASSQELFKELASKDALHIQIRTVYQKSISEEPYEGISPIGDNHQIEQFKTFKKQMANMSIFYTPHVIDSFCTGGSRQSSHEASLIMPNQSVSSIGHKYYTQPQEYSAGAETLAGCHNLVLEKFKSRNQDRAAGKNWLRKKRVEDNVLHLVFQGAVSSETTVSPATVNLSIGSF